MPEPIKWSGKTTSHHHKWHDTPNPEGVKSGFRKIWYLDAQWSTCPIEVGVEVKKMWEYNKLGNDFYCIHTSLEDLDPEYVATRQYILEMQPDIAHDEQIIIHWWW